MLDYVIIYDNEELLIWTYRIFTQKEMKKMRQGGEKIKAKRKEKKKLGRN